MKVTQIWLILQITSCTIMAKEQLPICLARMINEAFDKHTKTIYLVGLENLDSFEAYLSLPYPKVILSKNDSIVSADATCLVVLYLEISNGLRLYTFLSAVMKTVGNHSSEAKFVVLIDDVLIQHSAQQMARDIGMVFAVLGIPYWCVTGYRAPFHIYYTVQLARGLLMHKVKCDVDKIFGTHRALPMLGATLVGQVLSSFPYSYWDADGSLRGLDVFIFLDICDYLKSKFIHKSIETRDSDSHSTLLEMVSNLQYIEVDFMLSRRSISYGNYPSVCIPENINLCLIVPRSFRVDLLTSLMRPFDSSVWMILGIVVGVFQFKRLLLRTNSAIGQALVLLESHHYWQTFTTIAVEWMSFILIECYLAQVTSFFLDFRFQQDPQTLEQFFGTNIPIRLPEDQKHLLELLTPDLVEAIERRAVTEEACAEFSADCAHLDRYIRAAFVIKYYQPIDASTGAKRSYILKESVSYQPWSYVFARGSALKDLFAVYLQRMYEAGIPQWHTNIVTSYIESPQLQYEESLELKHLASVWIFSGIGWIVSAIVFAIELVVGHFLQGV